MQPQPEPCQENQASFSEFPASADQESETDQCGELSMYEIEAKSSMAGWEGIREGLLSAVTESQGMPSSQMCVLCDESPALIRCRQCGPRSYYCQICFDTVHSRITFLHAAERWMVRCLNTLVNYILATSILSKLPGSASYRKFSWRGRIFNFQKEMTFTTQNDTTTSTMHFIGSIIAFCVLSYIKFCISLVCLRGT